MSARTTTILTILTIAFTGFAAALILVGTPAAILLLALTTLALAGWLWTGDTKAPTGLMAPYLTVPPLFLAMGSAQFAGGWVTHLQADYAAWFDPDFAFTGANWFVLLVCIPASLVLFGGYLLARNQPAGFFMAWWTALFAVASGVIQIAGAGLWQAQPLALLASGFGLALIFAGLAIVQRLLRPRAASVPVPAPFSTQRRLLWAVLFAAAMVVYGATLFTQAGPLPVIIVVGSMVGGMLGWLLTTSRRPVDPTWAVPLLLLLLTLFYLHVGEETLTDFNGMIATITGKPWADDDFLLLIGLLGPIVWVFAAWSLWHRQALGNFIFWFLIVGMILGEPTHLLIFPIRLMAINGGGYEYASGMYSALFPMIPAIVALLRILSDHRAARLA
ncbi:MAG: hypothetical protein H6898_13640 [Rhodobacter sp.]|nr:hypothetical protein [Paracoccaceae bacterium]MCC0077600.1 hypothetical protein [Rhodobacter sp.]